MKKVIIFVIFILLVIGATLIYDKGIMKKENNNEKDIIVNQTKKQVRKPVAAGTFYPGNETELSSMIDEFLDKAELPQLKPYIRALIVPHAGYIYSGQVAAYGYKALIGKNISTVILIGNSHQEYFDGISIYPDGYFETPLGKVEIDTDFTKKLIEADNRIYFKESAHIEEHSLEVQLPFLQKILESFKIVPIIIGNQPGVVEILINALKPLMSDDILLIASTDLSHYPSYEDAKYADNKTITGILSGKKDEFKKAIIDLEKENIPNLQTCACGHDAIEAVMGLTEGKKTQLLKYANSGDVSMGDKSQVVGYAAIVFMDSTSSPQASSELDKEQQKRLLEIAKQSLEAYLKEGKTLKFEEKDLLLNKPMGIFVTLKEHGELRGCIGIFESDTPLYQAVAEIVISSAINDPRFTPVSKEELPLLEYEISVLSQLKKVNSYQDIKIGKHGVKIVKGSRSGVFLPQVSTENNWDRETFLSILCTQKVGLENDCYKDKDIELYVFTAQIFGE